MIVKSRLAGALPQLSSAEFEASVEAWREVVDGEVPERDLDAAYIRAMRDKTSGFGLAANDIVKGYRDNCESERVAPMPQDVNLLNGQVCPRCFGTGLEEYVEHGYKVARRCDHVVAEVQRPSVIVDEDSEVDSW